MRTFNSRYEVSDLLALAAEIQRTERVDKQEAMHRALAELPRLVNDFRTDRRYVPASARPVAVHVVYNRRRAG